MKLFQQLWHAGHASPRADGGQPWSASDMVNPRVNIVPIPMTKTMIDDVVAGYARTARLMEEWGMDGVDVHARSEEHTSELQSLMRISYAVFCLKKKIKN